MTGEFLKQKKRLFGNKDADDLIDEMQDSELIDIFKNKKCKKCGSPVTEHLLRYSGVKKVYLELSKDKLDSYKRGMNNEIKKIVKRKQEALKNAKIDENITDDWILVDDGYDPFTMNISYDEYLAQKKSDESDQQSSDR